MGIMLPAMIAAGGFLGGLGGLFRSKNSKKPSSRKVVLPPQQLGGWEKLQEIMQSMKSAPQYRPGASNPYLQGGMQHIFNRAGVQAPEGGYGPNPYQQPPPQSQTMPVGGASNGIPPEVLDRIMKLYGNGGR